MKINKIFATKLNNNNMQNKINTHIVYVADPGQCFGLLWYGSGSPDRPVCWVHCKRDSEIGSSVRSGVGTA